MEQQNSTAHSSREPEGVWRNEVQARVAGYRSRRGRRIEGAFSMRFPFPPAEAASAAAEAPTPESQSSLSELAGAEHEVQPVLSAIAQAEVFENDVPSEPRTKTMAEAPTPDFSRDDAGPNYEEVRKPRVTAGRSRRKVIAFPKPAVVPNEAWDEPLLSEQPRILDVAEELPALPSTPLLDGLVFASHGPQAAAVSADHVDLPLQAVPIRQRVYASIVDCGLVVAAAGVFGAACYKFMPNVTPAKPLLLGITAIPLLLWAAYQYIFLVYGGKTAGMHWVGIRLGSFKGGFPRYRQRRSRVIGLYFSTASLMMGLLWALVDVDALCWHDRISRTYLTKASD